MLLRIATLLFVSLGLGGQAGANPAVQSRATELPRTTVDRPNQEGDNANLVKLVYVTPSDGPDNGYDTDGSIGRSFWRGQDWMFQQTVGKSFALDTYQGQPDIAFLRLPYTEAQVEQGVAIDGRPYDHVGLVDYVLRHSAAFPDPNDVFVAYYDVPLGSHFGACGEAVQPLWPVGTAPHATGVYYLTPTCTLYPIDRDMDTSLGAVHELVHALGFIPSCSPHQGVNGHVSDDPHDLMFTAQGVANATPKVLDVGRDDYYDPSGRPIGACRAEQNLANSPYLVGINYHRLELAVSGESSVSVDLLPVGCSGPGQCGTCPSGSCSFWYRSGQTVTVTANQPLGPSRFSAWGGACSGQGHCQVVMNADQTVSATFIQLATLSLSIVGKGTIKVPGQKPTICRRQCDYTLDPGVKLALVPIANKGWRFARWGGCTGIVTCKFALKADKEVRAVFVKKAVKKKK